jgi:uncharacterized protein (TIGR02145 family)
MKTINIGSQVWTKKNLKVFKFRNGEYIPIVQDNQEWSKMTSAAMCINPDNGECYYNWYAVNDPRGLAPEGFHVPTDAEWSTLTKELGGNAVAGELMKSTKKWDGAGFLKGFDAIPSEYRIYNGKFIDEHSTSFWTSTPNKERALCRSLYTDYSNVDHYDAPIQNGFSVRLIKD